jgi:hypothetical protein
VATIPGPLGIFIIGLQLGLAQHIRRTVAGSSVPPVVGTQMHPGSTALTSALLLLLWLCFSGSETPSRTSWGHFFVKESARHPLIMESEAQIEALFNSAAVRGAYGPLAKVEAMQGECLVSCCILSFVVEYLCLLSFSVTVIASESLAASVGSVTHVKRISEMFTLH